jgi:hypothetical protein
MEQILAIRLAGRLLDFYSFQIESYFIVGQLQLIFHLRNSELEGCLQLILS